MADRYIDSAYITDHWGSGLLTAITDITGIDLDVKIEGSTAVIQAALKNSGYSYPSTQDPAEVEDEMIKLGVLGHLVNQLSAIPGVSLPVPDVWNDEELMGPGAIAKLIISGDLPSPESDPDTLGAVGGFVATEADPDVTGARFQYTSRTELDNF